MIRAFALSSSLTVALLASFACTTPKSHAPSSSLATPVEAPKAPAIPYSTKPTAWHLTVVHFSDSEAGLLPDDASADGGGLARAQALISALKNRAGPDGVVLAAGDMFIPAPELDLEIDGKSAILQSNNMLGIQASALGNHELDRGEEFLASAIAMMKWPYLTATLTVNDGPLKKVLADMSNGTPWAQDIAGKLAPRAKLCVAEQGIVDGKCTGLVVGLVGSTTEQLRLISKGASADLATPNDAMGVKNAIQAQVDALKSEGVNVIVLLSHLQAAAREAQLVKDGLVGVDVIVAGGGENKLASEHQRLLDGDTPDVLCKTFGEPCYPTALVAKDGAPVLLVATAGDLRYVGDLVVTFDADGVLTGFNPASKPWPADDQSLLELRARVDKGTLAFQQRVREELQPLLVEVGASSVFLEGTREDVRNRETNLGDLSADAIAFSAQKQGAAFALRNSGGIRASIGIVDSITGQKKGGPIRLLDLKTALRFDSKVVVVDVTHAQVKRTLESALRGAGTSKGQFPQASSSVKLAYTTDAPEQTHELKDGRIVGVRCEGARVRELVVGGDVIVKDGIVVDPDKHIKMATIDYLANGGDGWFPGEKDVPRVAVEGATEQSSIKDFIAAEESAKQWQAGARYVDGSDARIHKVAVHVDAPAACR